MFCFTISIQLLILFYVLQLAINTLTSTGTIAVWDVQLLSKLFTQKPPK